MSSITMTAALTRVGVALNVPLAGTAGGLLAWSGHLHDTWEAIGTTATVAGALTLAVWAAGSLVLSGTAELAAAFFPGRLAS